MLSVFIYLYTFFFDQVVVYSSREIDELITIKHGILSRPRYTINQLCQKKTQGKKSMYFCEKELYRYSSNLKNNVCSSRGTTNRFFKRNYTLSFRCYVNLFGRKTIINKEHTFIN